MCTNDSAEVFEYDGNVDPPAPTITLSVASVLEEILDLPVPEKASSPQVMLLDTGAAVSVLPHEVIEELEALGGLKIPYSNCALEGVDGKLQLSKLYNLQVVKPSGEHMGDNKTVDFAVGRRGLLGRNFINQYKIVLDGPAEIWCCASDVE